MGRVVARRLLLLIPVVLGVLTFVFFILHLIPGDPVEVMLGETATAADRAQLRQQLGLDRPLLQQYLAFLTRAARGDLGQSLHSHEQVSTLLLRALPATLELASGALLISLFLAIPLGVLAATHPSSPLDQGSMLAALVGVSIPNFWLGPMLILLFSVELGWLPVSGRGGLRHLILPALTLGMALSALLSRMTRSSLLETIRADYVTTARAKGLREGVVILRHALGNALIPIITVVGLQFGTLLSGSLITETIFAWPGIGQLTIQAIHTRDYPLVQGTVMVIALIYVTVNLLTDLLYAAVDPRIRYR